MVLFDEKIHQGIHHVGHIFAAFEMYSTALQATKVALSSSREPPLFTV